MDSPLYYRDKDTFENEFSRGGELLKMVKAVKTAAWWRPLFIPLHWLLGKGKNCKDNPNLELNILWCRIGPVDCWNQKENTHTCQRNKCSFIKRIRWWKTREVWTLKILPLNNLELFVFARVCEIFFFFI